MHSRLTLLASLVCSSCRWNPGDYSIHTNPKPVRSAAQVLEVLEAAW